MTDRKTIAVYNRSWKELTEYYDKSGVREKDVQKIMDLYGKPSPNVFEIGCGPGRDAVEILKYTDSYTGIDPAENFIIEAKKRSPRGDFRVVDALAAKIPPCDVVIAFASLLHLSIEDLEELFIRLGSRLGSGGIVFLSLKKGVYRRYLKEDKFGTRVFFNYEPADITNISSPNFETVAVEHSKVNGSEWFEISLRKK